MTEPAAHTGPSVFVAGVDAAGTEVVRERLRHGDDPARLLGRHGYAVLEPRTVVAQVDPHEITVVFEVGPADVESAEAAEPTPRDTDLAVTPGEQAVVVQRLAVYAIVHSTRGLLLTENSARTNLPGTWALPGGGLDLGELPEDALHREVWEETGQRVRIASLVAVTTRHWVGRAPDGRLEDFHAVRMVYRATCDEPTDPIVHDVDGTTASADWFAMDRVTRLPLASGTRDLVRRLIADDA